MNLGKGSSPGQRTVPHPSGGGAQETQGEKPPLLVPGPLTRVYVVAEQEFLPRALHSAQCVDGPSVCRAEGQVVGQRDGEGEVPHGQGRDEGPAISPGVVAFHRCVEAGAAVRGQQGVQIPASDGIDVMPDHCSAEVPSALWKKQGMRDQSIKAKANR